MKNALRSHRLLSLVFGQLSLEVMIAYGNAYLAIFSSGVNFMKQNMYQYLPVMLPVNADPLRYEVCLNNFKLRHVRVLLKCMKRVKQFIDKIRE